MTTALPDPFLGLDEISDGVYDALCAAAEEHDRDDYETICPAVVTSLGRSSDGAIHLETNSGRRFRIVVEEAS